MVTCQEGSAVPSAVSELAERQARRALAVAAESGDPTSARDRQEALANVLGFRGDLDAARLEGERTYELAVAADVLAMVLMDPATQSVYGGRHDEATRHEATFAVLVEQTGSVTGRALLAYVRASAGPSGATRTRRGTWRRP
jgi:hypothetical protein